MKVGVCTLFEGSYSLGMAALINSLVKNGFKGPIFAGYKGKLPEWDQSELLKCGVQLQFIQVGTSNHLANVKPDFMIDILGKNGQLTHLCYFDPDIVLGAKWGFIEEWLSCGVALCEDVNSPLSINHPRRVGWHRHLAHSDRKFCNHTDIYVNAGFVGISRESMSFLHTWKCLSQEMAHVIGSLAVTKVVGGEVFGSRGFANCFDCPDQDALNATLEVDSSLASIVGKNGMGFQYGEILMYHAIGRDKPWERNFLKFASRGVPPRVCDKAFFQHLDSPLRVAIPGLLRRRASLALSSLIGRVWRRAA